MAPLTSGSMLLIARVETEAAVTSDPEHVRGQLDVGEVGVEHREPVEGQSTAMAGDVVGILAGGEDGTRPHRKPLGGIGSFPRGAEDVRVASHPDRLTAAADAT